MLTAVQTKLARTIPLVIISFNGGKGTLEVIAKGMAPFLFCSITPLFYLDLLISIVNLLFPNLSLFSYFVVSN
jgi:hypothetical protein